jgi:hypothetical protein
MPSPVCSRSWVSPVRPSIKSIENPNDVTVTHDFKTEAQAFMSAPEVKSAMDKGGVKGTPQIWIRPPSGELTFRISPARYRLDFLGPLMGAHIDNAHTSAVGHQNGHQQSLLYRSLETVTKMVTNSRCPGSCPKLAMIG